jgi:hypothetical protein
MAVGTISVDDFANIAHTTTGFAVAAFKAPVALASYDTLAHALDAGTVLHHIA